MSAYRVREDIFRMFLSAFWLIYAKRNAKTERKANTEPKKNEVF